MFAGAGVTAAIGVVALRVQPASVRQRRTLREARGADGESGLVCPHRPTSPFADRLLVSPGHHTIVQASLALGPTAASAVPMTQEHGLSQFLRAHDGMLATAHRGRKGTRIGEKVAVPLRSVGEFTTELLRLCDLGPGHELAQLCLALSRISIPLRGSEIEPSICTRRFATSVSAKS